MKRQQGSQTLEFAMIALPFVLLILAIFELTRFLWINMIFESAVNSAMREVRVLSPSYTADQKFAARIAEFPLLRSEDIEVSQPRYAKTFAQLAQKTSVSSSQAILGEYSVSYRFAFLVVPRLNEAFSEVMTLKRTVVVSYDR
ncbi:MULTISPECIES: TadE/TadG family type IV pilus assembly protein [Vibrio]|uniref:TadE-like domain-containing protein n=1 Tax=Vibrio bivalvicida TaxID=1276888 RepID=A0A177XXT0_9VIBR|nr:MULTISPECIES: TadE family protein [Vibrio]KLN66727.1 hypothetical protein ZX61_03495 [Vibrio sp. VPAP30]OAJ93410.1 hypothetical protein APB76_15745 [Vibrio bivalvicida]